MPAQIAESAADRLTEREPGILHRMMKIDVEVALGGDVEVDQAVTGELIEHMVEKSDAGRDTGGPGPVEIDGDLELGLFGLARDGGAAHGFLFARPDSDCPDLDRPDLGSSELRPWLLASPLPDGYPRPVRTACNRRCEP